jgi:tryptophan-rich sensory protein
MLDNKELHLLVPVVFGIILFAVIALKNWFDKKKSPEYSGSSKSSPLSNPILGIVWIAVLVCLGNANYILYKNNKISFASIFLTFVIVYCLSYPIILIFYKKKSPLLNVIAMILASISLTVIYQESTEALLYVIPLFIWISYLNYSDAVICSSSFSKPTSKKKDKKKYKKITDKKNDFIKRLILA